MMVMFPTTQSLVILEVWATRAGSAEVGRSIYAQISATTIDDGGDGAAAARKVHCGVTLMGLQAAAALVGRYIDRTTTC
jgi:hypothetical protein